jgi:hypothetical protein
MTIAKTANRKQYAALVAQRVRDKLNTADAQLHPRPSVANHTTGRLV